MRRLVLLSVLALCLHVLAHASSASPSATFAASPFIPAGYYDTVDTSSASALRLTLHEVIDDHTRFPYTSPATDTWDILDQADEDPNNPSNILDVYKNASYPKAGAGNANYQREHTWPSSYGFPTDNVTNYPYTDAHHLFLANGSYNASRSNLPYDTCNATCLEKPTDVNNGKGGGSGTYPGNSDWRTGSGSTGTWETWAGRQGDVARALLYLDVRYEGGTHGIAGTAEPDLILTDDRGLIATSGSNASTAHMGMLAVLLQWHVDDPVDDVERSRNEVVFGFQGNRNPFIDHPEWVAILHGRAAFLRFFVGDAVGNVYPGASATAIVGPWGWLADRPPGAYLGARLERGREKLALMNTVHDEGDVGL